MDDVSEGPVDELPPPDEPVCSGENEDDEEDAAVPFSRSALRCINKKKGNRTGQPERAKI